MRLPNGAGRANQVHKCLIKLEKEYSHPKQYEIRIWKKATKLIPQDILLYEFSLTNLKRIVSALIDQGKMTLEANEGESYETPKLYRAFQSDLIYQGETSSVIQILISDAKQNRLLKFRDELTNRATNVLKEITTFPNKPILENKKTPPRSVEEEMLLVKTLIKSERGTNMLSESPNQSTTKEEEDVYQTTTKVEFSDIKQEEENEEFQKIKVESYFI